MESDDTNYSSSDGALSISGRDALVVELDDADNTLVDAEGEGSSAVAAGSRSGGDDTDTTMNVDSHAASAAGNGSSGNDELGRIDTQGVVIMEESSGDSSDLEADALVNEVLNAIARRAGFGLHAADALQLESQVAVASSEPEAEEPDDCVNDADITFDREVAARHEYMEGDFEECHGFSVFDVHSTQTLPLLTDSTVVYPGQYTVLKIPPSSSMTAVEHAAAPGGGNTLAYFGFPNARFYEYHHYYSDQEFLQRALKYHAGVGVICELKAHKQATDHLLGRTLNYFDVKMMARQRYKLVSVKSINGVRMATLIILPEIDSCPAVTGNAPSHHRSVGCIHGTIPLTKACSVYGLLNDWNIDTRLTPTDPVRFSYWVAQNLPVDHYFKVVLLQTNSLVQRLRILRQCLQLLSPQLICTNNACQVKISSRKHVFSMSTSGMMGAYVNPSGVVHEILTVRKAKNVDIHGRKSTEFSWFPGYAWQTITCSSCTQHVGWKFTTDSSNLKPKKFWGLTRSSVRPRFDLTSKPVESDEEEAYQDAVEDQPDDAPGFIY